MELGKEMFKLLIMSEKPSPINIHLHSRINQEEARLFICNDKFTCIRLRIMRTLPSSSRQTSAVSRWYGSGPLRQCIPSRLLPVSFPFARSIYPICILPRISNHAAAGETNLEIEGAGTGAIHIADSSLFVPAVSATQRDLLQAVQLRLGHTGGGTPGAIPRQ